MMQKHALGMVVVGAPPVRPVQGGAICSTTAEPIATHSPTVPFLFTWCYPGEPRRAQRRAGVVAWARNEAGGTGTPLSYYFC